MKFNLFFYCKCGFEKSLNDGDNFSILQCETCYHIENYQTKQRYMKECTHCGQKEELIEGTTFEKEVTCQKCGLKGKVGLAGVHKNYLFMVDVKDEKISKCKRCKQNNWINIYETDLKCPLCHKRLQTNMSSYWEDEKNDD